MKKIISIVSIVVVLATLFCACEKASAIPDGTYRITADSPDFNGYTDFITFEFKDGQMLSMVADATAEDGSLKSENSTIKDTMQSLNGTYPEKFYKDLVNQYIGSLDPEAVDVVAGATISSEAFIELISEAQREALSGNADAFERLD